MNSMPDESDFDLSSLPWQEILELAKSDQFAKRFENIPTETLRFAAEESNRPILIKSALKSLQTSEPENANLKYATRIAAMMRKFALRVLNEKESK